MCSTCTPSVDPSGVEAFGERLVSVLNNAGLALMISIGHRTGLFDVLHDAGWPTSEQIAARAQLQERYVREWLGALVTSGIITYRDEDRTYHLPAEHASLLIRSAGPDNFATTMQWISVLGCVEDQIVECFKRGGGVHYGAFTRFHEVMAEESESTVVAALREHILPMVSGLQDRLMSGIDVLDVGCGSGRALLFLAAQFPNSRFTGYDFSEEAIAKAKTMAQERGLNNVTFALRDVANLGEMSRYDLVTAYDAIHDQRDPSKVLCEIHAALRDDGTFLMQDIASSSHLEKNVDRPLAPFLYTISTMHCMTVSLAQGGAGLGTCWGEELASAMLAEAGFGSIELLHSDHDILNSYYISRKA